MWESTLDGRVLHFELYGINNQNFIMRDQETGTWWQQVSGEAIQGPWKGKRLTLMAHEEISFGLWKKSHDTGRILLPDSEFLKKEAYASSDWEKRIAKLPVQKGQVNSDLLPAREIIIGLQHNGFSKAYPLNKILMSKVILDKLGETPVLVAVGNDGLTIRAFDRMVDGKALEFFFKQDDNSYFVDSNSGSKWNFEGVAISGPLAGKKLETIPNLRDFWFDWFNYHPQTLVY